MQVPKVRNKIRGAVKSEETLLYRAGANLMYDPAQNEPEVGQGFTLSSSRPSQSIPGMILRLGRSGLQVI